MKLLVLCVLILSVPITAVGDEYKKLSGSYRIGGSTLSDPPTNEPQDTHLYFELDGATAKDLYSKMKVKASQDVCGEESEKTKRLGEMQCTQSADGKSYRCWFGLDIKKQKIVNGVLC